MQLHIFLAFLGVASAVVSLLSVVLLRFTLTRRLKNRLQPTDDYWDTGTLDFGFMNTYLFAWACTVPGFSRLKKFQAVYPGLDVRGYSKWFERWAAYGTIGGLFLFFVCGIIVVSIEP
ncbi:hypothetical protein [uncultured Marinobacter sp.]|uniref:hypothetical protein n=1 Tax=uncultured Marinobacter sp. TaxID=187379 RepID=UPI0030D769FE